MSLTNEHILELILRVENERIKPAKRRKRLSISLGTGLGSYAGSFFGPVGFFAGGIIGGCVMSLITGYESFEHRIKNVLSDIDRKGLIQVVREAIIDLGNTLEEIWECLMSENEIMQEIIRVITGFFLNMSIAGS